MMIRPEYWKVLRMSVQNARAWHLVQRNTSDASEYALASSQIRNALADATFAIVAIEDEEPQ